MAAFPGVSLELYPEAGPVQVMRPSDWNDKHAQLTGLPFQEITSPDRNQVDGGQSAALPQGGLRVVEGVVVVAEEQLVVKCSHRVLPTFDGSIIQLLGAKRNSILPCCFSHLQRLKNQAFSGPIA